ncbi:short-chain dehydrogenase [Vibrio pectenicida]|uniref:Short-chain dehydrogenase n=1 Tax=Vibrio pectenicida TaxID=62763 RepID=A0A7Y4ECQ6_9VIBR|nr:short-chain dehydrogenase [Vibrio pectenicida]
MINISDKKIEDAIVPIFRLGFRPFFLLGASYAAIAIALWVWMFQAGQSDSLQVPALWWHVHEMLFGFSMAIVVGFVLTAVQNWTGINGTKSYRLALLVSLWVIPRVLFWTESPVWLIATIETLFIALAAYETGFRVLKAKGWRNAFFIPLFVLAIFANLASYASLQGIVPFSSAAVWQAMLWWFTLLLSVMGARVIPFFTARRLNFQKPQSIAWLEWLAILPLITLFVISFSPSILTQFGQFLLLLSGLAHLIIVVRWKPWRTYQEPLLWSLHLAYLCIPISLLLRAGLSNAFAAHTMLHLFAIGALGGLVLAMITRVTMGHTGYSIYQGPNMAIAFAMLMTAALIRSVGVAFWPEQIILLVNISGLLWFLAFTLYVLKFGFMLLKPRIDGHPG